MDEEKIIRKIFLPKSESRKNCFTRADFFPKIFNFYHQYESIHFYSAEFLSFQEKSGPLLQP